MMTIVQLRKDLSHDESTLAAIVVFEKGSSSVPTSTKTLLPLHEHHDPKQEGQILGLTPPREINHKISFMSPTTNRCHAAQPELVEFYK